MAEPCVCGKDGCLETWLSIPSLQAQLAQHDQSTDDGGNAADDGVTAVLREAGGVWASPWPRSWVHSTSPRSS